MHDNYFLAGLAECIDIPNGVGAYERNHFGFESVFGSSNTGSLRTHRHIRASHPTAEGQTTGLWITNNVFTGARRR